MRKCTFFTCMLFCVMCLSTGAYAWNTVLDDTISTGGSSGQTGSVAIKNKGVGLVVVSVPGKGPDPIGTAWLYKKDLLATNAHVAIGVKQYLNLCEEKGLGNCVPYYVPNGSKGEAVQIVSMSVHPRYNKIVANVNGKRPVNSPDVATMGLKEPVGEPLLVASQDSLDNLTPGQPVYYVGFPMEKLLGDNVNINDVVAITQTGSISAMSDWWLGDSGKNKNKLIRHNMGIAGGASGSPVFNEEGRVIGLVNAGNMIGAVFTKDGKPERAPSAVLVNYAVRVDLLRDIKSSGIVSDNSSQRQNVVEPDMKRTKKGSTVSVIE